MNAARHPAAAPRTPLLIAHRGASAHAPENTLAAFERAFADGADWIECDVRLTADGVPVVLHDATLDRTTSGTGPIESRSLAEIRDLDAGAWFSPRYRGERIPTLAETLELVRGRGGLNIELKCGPRAGPVREAHRRQARAVAMVLAAAGFTGPLVVSSFSRPALRAARAAMPRIRLGFLASRTTRGLVAMHRAVGLFALHPHVRLATRDRFAAARRLRLRVLAWAADDPREARRLVDLGADGLMVDDPVALGRLLGRAPTPGARPLVS